MLATICEAKKTLFTLFFGLILAFINFNASGNENPEQEIGIVEEIREMEHEIGEEIRKDEEAFNAGELIMHHIADSHEWHLYTFGHYHGTIPLPVIVYTASGGLEFHSSSEFSNEHHEPVAVNGLVMEHDKIHAENGEKVWDFSITKNVMSMIISAVLLLVIFIGIGKKYKKNPDSAPSGLQSAFEPIIVFVRDEIAKTNIGSKHYERFMPYLLTIFFYIWFNNMMGLIPGAANVTGNIAITGTLAIIAFIVTNLNGKSTYWTHIFAMPGVPKWMLIILTPVEIVGVFMKPFSLMVRLFANVSAGHIILLSLISLIFIFKSAFLGIAVVPFSIFMNVIELIVALIQAYIFTMLVSTYIGAAIEEGHH